MFVSVAYHDPISDGFKTGREYTYRTALALRVGDIVAAPVRNRGSGAAEDKRAMVIRVGLPEPPFPCAEIAKLWEAG